MVCFDVITYIRRPTKCSMNLCVDQYSTGIPIYEVRIERRRKPSKSCKTTLGLQQQQKSSLSLYILHCYRIKCSITISSLLIAPFDTYCRVTISLPHAMSFLRPSLSSYVRSSTLKIKLEIQIILYVRTVVKSKSEFSCIAIRTR